MAAGSPFPKTKTFEGYMTFNAENSASRSRRYFVLNHNFLIGAKFKDSAKLSIAISIESARIDVDKTNPMAFIVTRKNKKYHFMASNLVEAKQWVYALQKASTLKITDIYRLCHEIAQNYGSKATFIDAQNRESKAKVIIKAINKKRCSKSDLRQQIPMIKQMQKYQNIIEITDVFETKRYLYLILTLSEPQQITKESIICDAIHQITSNAMNANENDNNNGKDIVLDYWIIGIIGYIMASGHIPSWIDLNQNNDNNLNMNITECMQTFLNNMLDCHLTQKYTLNEISLLTSSEALFLRGCDNFNSREHNLTYLFCGFVRKTGKNLYEKVPFDIIRVCIGFTYDNSIWKKVDGTTLKSEESLDKAISWLHYFTPKRCVIMRRLWQVKVKNAVNNRGPFLKAVVVQIDNLDAIQVPTVSNDDVVSILYIKRAQDMVKVGINGKEVVQRMLSSKDDANTNQLNYEKLSCLGRKSRYYPIY